MQLFQEHGLFPSTQATNNFQVSNAACRIKLIRSISTLTLYVNLVFTVGPHQFIPEQIFLATEDSRSASKVDGAK